MTITAPRTGFFLAALVYSVLPVSQSRWFLAPGVGRVSPVRKAASYAERPLPCLDKTSANPQPRGRKKEDRATRESLAYYYEHHFNPNGNMTGMVDGLPAAVTFPNGKPSTICFVQKVASTRWKHLIMRSFGWEPVSGDPEIFGHIHNPGSEAWASTGIWDNVHNGYEYAESILNTDMSFIIVRNPFMRLLSGFLDKAAPAKAAGCAPHIFNNELGLLDCHPDDMERRIAAGNPDYSPHAFAVFVTELYGQYLSEGHLNRLNAHFAPTASRCGLDWGVHFKYFLKVEEEEQWYPEIIAELGLEDLVEKGWAKYSGFEYDEERDCFYKPDGMRCRDMNSLVRTTGSGQECSDTTGEEDTAQLRSAGSMIDSKEHSTGADSKVHLFYTPALVAMVAEMFKADLDTFGYPILELHAYE